MRVLITEIVKLLSAVTSDTPIVIMNVLVSALVTASVEQIPRIWMRIGLLSQILFLNTFPASLIEFLQ